MSCCTHYGSGVRDSAPQGQERSDAEPLIDVDDIQGNILAGFNKDHQLLLALRLREPAAARAWLGRVLPHISTHREVSRFNALFKERKARMAGAEPVGLVATWANISFSHAGLAALSSRDEADAIPDDSFRAGMPEQAAGLGDRDPDGGADPTAGWVVGARGNIPDVLLTIAGDVESLVMQLASLLRPHPADAAGPVVIWEEMGRTRRDLPGHEHFGFKDGISQPAVRGVLGPLRPLSPRELEPALPGKVDCASPGNPLVWPGQFVFGYPSTNGTSEGGGGPVAVPAMTPPWLRNGSLLVFRRLRQDVVGFHEFLRAEAARLAATAEFAGMTAARLGALLVGRWPSGAPVMRSPQSDLPALGEAGALANDFDFDADTEAPRYLPGFEVNDQFPRARADRLGSVCPHGAHIRKVNPRDQDTDKGDRFDTLRRRVLRRGIPYGDELPVPFDGPMPADDGVDRGLHFLCFQTSIVEQFEVLQATWANSSDKPKPSGTDMIIGQGGEGARSLELLSESEDEQSVSTPRLFVFTTGGGYFFAPSLSALADFCRRS